MFPKPKKGSGKAARRRRKQKLVAHRKKVNDEVCERDGYQCQYSNKEGKICGQYSDHAHHVFGRGNSPEHKYEQPESRILLCDSHHYALHHQGTITRAEIIRNLERVLRGAENE